MIDTLLLFSCWQLMYMHIIYGLDYRYIIVLTYSFFNVEFPCYINIYVYDILMIFLCKINTVKKLVSVFSVWTSPVLLLPRYFSSMSKI